MAILFSAARPLQARLTARLLIAGLTTRLLTAGLTARLTARLTDRLTARLRLILVTHLHVFHQSCEGFMCFTAHPFFLNMLHHLNYPALKHDIFCDFPFNLSLLTSVIGRLFSVDLIGWLSLHWSRSKDSQSIQCDPVKMPQRQDRESKKWSGDQGLYCSLLPVSVAISVPLCPSLPSCHSPRSSFNSPWPPPHLPPVRSWKE